MKNLKKLVALAVLMTVSINVTASDFGTWLGAEAEKKVGKFSFELGAGFRAQNNMKSVERWDASFGISYKPFKFLKFAVGYNYIYQYRIEEKRNHYDEYEQAYEDRPSEIIREYDGYNINKPYWRSKNRFKFDITGDVNIGRFNISLRERYQFTTFTILATNTASTGQQAKSTSKKPQRNSRKRATTTDFARNSR